MLHLAHPRAPRVSRVVAGGFPQVTPSDVWRPFRVASTAAPQGRLIPRLSRPGGWILQVVVCGVVLVVCLRV